MKRHNARYFIHGSRGVPCEEHVTHLTRFCSNRFQCGSNWVVRFNLSPNLVISRGGRMPRDDWITQLDSGQLISQQCGVTMGIVLVHSPFLFKDDNSLTGSIQVAGHNKNHIPVAHISSLHSRRNCSSSNAMRIYCPFSVESNVTILPTLCIPSPDGVGN